MKGKWLISERNDSNEQQKPAEAPKRKEKGKTIFACIAAAAVLGIAALLLTTKVFLPNAAYHKAVALMDEGQYKEAITAFEAMDGYKDSENLIEECKVGQARNKLQQAASLMDEGKYDKAEKLLQSAISSMSGNLYERFSAEERKEAVSRRHKCSTELQVEAMENISVGDTVEFGGKGYQWLVPDLSGAVITRLQLHTA